MSAKMPEIKQETCSTWRDALKAFGLNLIYLALLLLLFSPVNHLDDIYQWYHINGAFTGKTDYLLFWGNDALGKILQMLANINTLLPWYTILQYIMSFMGLCIFTYTLIRNRWGKTGWLVINIACLFLSYEAYIGVCFTKTAGMTCALGFYGLISERTGLKSKALSVILILYSVFLRNEYLLLNATIWFACVLVRLCYDLIISRGKEYWKLFGRYAKPIILIVGAFFICTTGAKLALRSLSGEYDDFYVRDRYRSRVYDWENIYKDYSENEEVYLKLGITRSETEMWNTNNFDSVYPSNDVLSSAFDVSTGNEAESPTLMQKALNSETISGFFKTFPLWFLKVDTFFAFLMVFLTLFLCTEHTDIRLNISGAIAFALLLLMNYYLFIGGRYARHRADVPVMALAFLVFMFLNEALWKDARFKFNSWAVLAVSILLLFVPRSFEDYASATSEYEKLAKGNRTFFDETYMDQEHVYFQIITNGKQGKPGYYEAYATTTPFDTLPLGYYRNIFFSFATPQKQEVWHEYGISDVFVDVVDNNGMYLILQNNSDMLDVTERYIEDRYGEDVTVTWIKSFANKNIYRVNSSEYDILSGIDYSNVGDGDLIENVTVRIDEDEHMNVVGSASIQGMNTFPQNVYVDIVDASTSEHRAYYVPQVLQKEGNGSIIARLDGKYSLPLFYSEDDRIYLVVENKGFVQAREMTPLLMDES